METSRNRAMGGQRSIIKGDIPIWRPKDGPHIMDIIPYAAGKNDPQADEGDPTYTLETHVHINVGTDNQMYLCTERMYGKKCPICEHQAKLREKGADEEKWKALFPKVRHLYNIISYDRGEEKKGVQVWDVPWFYSEKHLQALAQRPSRGGKKKKEINFPDEEEGKSVSFTIEPAKGKNDYPSYVGWAFEDRDYKIDDDVLDAAYVLDEIIHIPDYEEVSEAYWGKEKSRSKKRDDDDNDDDGDDDLKEALEELEDLEDIEELEDFIEEYDLEVKIKRKDDEDTIKEKIEEALEEKFASDPDDDDSDSDDDDDDDKPSYTKKQINKMKKKQLLSVIKDEELDIDKDDWDDVDELRDLVIEELEL